jgi:Uma2 family endonuclease
MNEHTITAAQSNPLGEPTWGIATLYPNQGDWSEKEYLALDTNHLIEFSNGHLEFLEMPETSHQRIVGFLYVTLLGFVTPSQLGEVLFAATKVRLWSRKFREPDIVFMLAEHRSRIGELFWKGADLVMEVVSSDRQHDYKTKRVEYAKAGISEYWIVDPQEKKITVLRLDGKRYAVHGEFLEGTVATSALLSGFNVEVNAVFAKR